MTTNEEMLNLKAEIYSFLLVNGEQKSETIAAHCNTDSDLVKAALNDLSRISLAVKMMNGCWRSLVDGVDFGGYSDRRPERFSVPVIARDFEPDF